MTAIEALSAAVVVSDGGTSAFPNAVNHDTDEGRVYLNALVK